MSADSTNLLIRHNPSAHRFEAEVEGQLAVAEYRREGEVMIFTHTEVPPSLRGGGIAGKLVQFALENAAREKVKIIPQCSYVEHYIRRHPEFAPLLKTAP